VEGLSLTKVPAASCKGLEPQQKKGSMGSSWTAVQPCHNNLHDQQDHMTPTWLVTFHFSAYISLPQIGRQLQQLQKDRCLRSFLTVNASLVENKIVS
jgi:hypothetical protein